MQSGKGLAIGLPTKDGITCIEWGIAIGTIQWPMNMNRLVIGTHGNNDIAASRQGIAEKAISEGCRYLFFLDDDVIVPSTCLLKMTYALEQQNPPIGKVAAVTGVYTGKCESSPPHIYTKPGEGPYWHWKKDQVFEIAHCGAGCLLIDLRVLAELPKPWFKFTLSENFSEGEDIYFCNLLADNGYKVLAHGGVLCKHWNRPDGKFYEMPADSYPMLPEVAPEPVAEKVLGPVA
jgi:GT2 family glycosyltransferase